MSLISKVLRAFPVFNGYAPAQGPKAINIPLDFTNTARIEFDTVQEEQNGEIQYIQTVYVDNASNPNALTLQFDQTMQRIVVPAYAQGPWPVICGSNFRCVATTTEGVVCSAILLNVPMPLAQYGPVTVNANVTANATPVQANITATSNAMTGGDDAVLAANVARKRVTIQAAANNAGPIAIVFGGGAPVLGTDIGLGPGERWDSGTGPVDARALHAIGTAGDVLNIWES